MAREQTIGEEIANSVTHGIGAALSVAALAILATLASLRGDALHVAGVTVFGVTLVLLYLASTLYHGFQSPGVKRLFRMIDHAAIYLLIAGTYTPFTLISLRGAWGWTLFGIVWGIAVVGIVLTLLYLGRARVLFTALYVGMGSIGVIAVKPLVASLSAAGLAWVVAGGLFYIFGVVFYLWRRLPYGHMVWHLCVLGGSACHFFGVLYYVLPPATPLA
ncbi:hemolysin III family protein [bacterium]|nr:hemolysin III family protein [bacterium]